MKTLRRLFKIIFSVAMGTGLTFGVYSKLLAFWRFDVLNAKHWKMIWRRWEDGTSFSTPKEVSFLLLIVLAPLFFGLLCFISYRIDWLNVLFFPFKKLRKAKKEKEIEKARHEAMSSATVAMKKAPAAKGGRPLPEKILRLRGTVQRTLASSHGGENDRTADNAITDQNIWGTLEKGLERNDIFTLREMEFCGCKFGLTAITTEGVYLLSSGPAAGNAWTTRDNADPPVWITETGEHLPSPVVTVQKARDALQQEILQKFPQFGDLTVNASVVLSHGKVETMQDLLSYLQETDMSVLRAGSCKVAGLPESTAIVELIKTQKQPSNELANAVSQAILNLTENVYD